MIEGRIWLALKPRLQTWTESDMAFPDQVYNPTADRPYVYVQTVWLDYPSDTLSFDCGEEYRGYLAASIRVPVGWDHAAHLGMAGRVMELFTYGAKYVYSGLTVQIHEKPRLFASSYLDGPFNRIDGRIPFRAWG